MAFDAFLRLDNIPGESLDSVHKGEIEIASLTYGGMQSGTEMGKFRLDDITVTKPVDVASVRLLKASATGIPVATGRIVVRKAGATPLEFLQIDLTNVLVRQVTTRGTPGDEIPMEDVTLSPERITLSYRPQLSDGKLGTAVTVTYDATTARVT
jgi:type VI secretion system secreted protein Hcp